MVFGLKRIYSYLLFFLKDLPLLVDKEEVSESRETRLRVSELQEVETGRLDNSSSSEDTDDQLDCMLFILFSNCLYISSYLKQNSIISLVCVK